MGLRLPFRVLRRGLHGREWLRFCGVALWLSIITAWMCALTNAGPGLQAQTSEYDVKAAYLFNFGKFMRVAGAAQPQQATFDICILGRDPIGQAIDEIVANESIDGRPVRVERMTDPALGRKCEIVFISPYESGSIREDLAALDGANVLTVSDAPDFLARGGMIQFVLQGDHVRFEVDLDAVNRAHLVLSSELLRVAAAVKGRPLGVAR